MQLESLVLPLKTDTLSFKAGLATAAAGVAALVGAIGLAIKATFDWAGDLDALGDVIGGTNEQMASLAYIARKSGTGVDTLSKAQTVLEKGLVKTDGTLDVTGKKLKEFGIDIFDVNGQMKDQTALIEEIGRKYNSLGTAQEKLNFLTEIYSKNGASMIDFFDVMAQEGGIDKVAQKVEALGLAIDPGRYEQFNRNLEELKLMGTALAVNFTEKVMPVLERFLGWVTTTATSPDVKKLKETIASWFDVDLENGIKVKVNWDKMTDDLAKGIDNIRWSELGDKFGDKLEEALTGGADLGDWGKVWEALWNGLRDWLISAMGGEEAINDIFTRLRDWGRNLPDKIMEGVQNGAGTLGGRITSVIKAQLQKFAADIQNWLNNLHFSIPNYNNNYFGQSYFGSTAPKRPGRASGGPVIAGQAYDVAEFYRPEVFTPTASGRIDPLKHETVVAQIDYQMLARVLRTELAQQFG